MKNSVLLRKINREYKCEECALSKMWNDKPLSLHIDHIDGNNKNNELSNLRYLCPNCHSQTSTYCGRNVKKKINNWQLSSDDEFIASIRQSRSVSESIYKLNFNPKNSLIRNKIKSLMEENAISFNESVKEIELLKIEQIRNSTIDFSKFGWVQHVSQILEITPQKVGKWMKRNMPEFYFEKCFVRKL